jgi:hypothetical protein
VVAHNKTGGLLLDGPRRRGKRRVVVLAGWKVIHRVGGQRRWRGKHRHHDSASNSHFAEHDNPLGVVTPCAIVRIIFITSGITTSLTFITSGTTTSLCADPDRNTRCLLRAVGIKGGIR